MGQVQQVQAGQKWLNPENMAQNAHGSNAEWDPVRVEPPTKGTAGLLENVQ